MLLLLLGWIVAVAGDDDDGASLDRGDERERERDSAQCLPC